MLLGCSLPVSALGEDGNSWSPQWSVGLGVGQTELEFPEKLDADTTFGSYHALVGLRLGRFSTGLTYGDALTRETISEEDELGEGERRDIDLTAGWDLNDAWTLFIGYKDGKTDLDLQVRDTDITLRESYQEEGLYAGVAYRHTLGRAGTLSLSLAYIDLDTDLRFSSDSASDDEDEEDDDEGESLEFDDLEGRVSGDATGYSAALGWILPVGDRTAVRVQYKINQYDLEVRAEGRRFKPEQRLNFFDLTLIHVF